MQPLLVSLQDVQHQYRLHIEERLNEARENLNEWMGLMAAFGTDASMLNNHEYEELCDTGNLQLYVPNYVLEKLNLNGDKPANFDVLFHDNGVVKGKVTSLQLWNSL